MKDRYETLHEQAANILGDLAILAGDIVGPSNATWQDVAGTSAVNLRSLADMLDSIRQGQTHFRGVPWEGPTVFPSPKEICDSL